MGAGTVISEQYLKTSFPGIDREFRDGELVERSAPDYLHSRTAIILGAFFEALRRTVSVYPCAELRLKLRDGLFLIPDICVFWPAPPDSPVPDTPPLIVVEILSPDDRLGEVREKLDEYRKWGVAHVALVDPHGRRIYSCGDTFAEVASLVTPQLSVELTPGAVFE